MKYKVDAFLLESEFHTFFKELSEEGKNSLSCQIIQKYYKIANQNLNSIRNCLRSYRDSNDRPVGIDPKELKPSSYRLEFELLALIATNLNQMPSLETIVKNDKQTTDEDKLVLLGAYQSFKNKVDGLFQLFGLPCFAVKAENNTSGNT